MNIFKKCLLAAAATAFATAGAAMAGPISGSFQISVYQGNGNGNEYASTEIADKSNPLINPSNLIGSGTYTGTINWNEGSSGSNNIANFLLSSGGTLSSGLAGLSSYMLSTAPFNLTSVFVITGNTGSNILGGTISHDDGASLYDGPGYGTTVAYSGNPTNDIATAYSGLVGPFELVYVEANGLPANLVMNVTSSVPEPLTLSLFGAGLAGIAGVSRRRRKAKAA